MKHLNKNVLGEGNPRLFLNRESKASLLTFYHLLKKYYLTMTLLLLFRESLPDPLQITLQPKLTHKIVLKV